MSQWSITFAQSFLNELIALPHHVSKQVTQKVKVLEEDPISARGDAKKLSGYKNNVYRVRIGDYRLVYSFASGWVKLLSVRKRDERTYEDDIPHADDPGAAPPEQAALDPQRIQPSVYPAHYDSPAVQPPSGSDEVARKQPLPMAITEEALRQWLIPAEYWHGLMAAKTEDDLFLVDLPVQLFDRVCDILFPRPIEELDQQPEYVLPQPEDLDRYVEGELTAFLLNLDADQQQMLDAGFEGPYLVKGGPGTGKSIIALYRVQRLVKEGRTPILFTTYTNALIGYSEQLLERLLGGPPEEHGVDVTTVDSLIYRRYAQAYGPPHFATEGQVLDLVERALTDVEIPASNVFDRKVRLEVLKKLGAAYLLDEFNDVIDSRGLGSREEYLGIERRGRGVPLRAPVRESLWALYEWWSAELDRQGITTWERVRRRVLDLSMQNEQKSYKTLVVDEAQDISPVALRFLLTLVESPQGLYLTADASQSLYQRGFSWRQIHGDLNMRGRSVLLKRNYRNTAEIMQACATIMQGNTAGDEESVNQEAAAHHGDAPTVILAEGSDDEILHIQEFFSRAARQFRLPIHAGVVLCHSQAVGQRIARRLSALGMPAEFMAGKDIDLRKPVVKVMTLHSSKGLEFPFVVVTRLEDGCLPYEVEHLPEEERMVAFDQQRRLFYVGCSRSMRALLVCGSQDKPSPFLSTLTEPYWKKVSL
jgi:mRNA-degrading endonuclease RelE of RelBE toxin-antitoxin system